jgi:hypothetical protein
MISSKISTPIFILLIALLLTYRLNYGGGRFTSLCNNVCSITISSFRTIIARLVAWFTTSHSPTAVLLCKSIMGMCEKTCNLTGLILP